MSKKKTTPLKAGKHARTSDSDKLAQSILAAFSSNSGRMNNEMDAESSTPESSAFAAVPCVDSHLGGSSMLPNPHAEIQRSDAPQLLDKIKEIESLVWETIRQRKEECLEFPSSEKDLLQLILEEAVNDVGKDSSKKFIVDNCKNIYFAGHESTAVAASWCLMLLALLDCWISRNGRSLKSRAVRRCCRVLWVC